MLYCNPLESYLRNIKSSHMEVHPNQTYSTSLEAINATRLYVLLRGSLLLGPALNDLDTQPLRLYQEERNHLGSC